MFKSYSMRAIAFHTCSHTFLTSRLICLVPPVVGLETLLTIGSTSELQGNGIKPTIAQQ